MFADYAYYTDSFLGTLIPEESYPALALRADALLEEITMGKCSCPDLPEDLLPRVKNAECAAAEELCRLDLALSGVDPSIQKETVGDYSVARASASDLTAEAEARAGRLIRRWLANTGLLYRGIPVYSRGVYRP